MKSQIKCFENLHTHLKNIASQTKVGWNDAKGDEFFNAVIQPLEDVTQSHIQAMNLLEQKLMEIKLKIDKI